MANDNSGTSTSRLARWRVWVQLGFLLAWLDPFMMRMHWICGPVFHCYSCPLATVACPIGILANFSALHLIPFAALGTLLVLGGVVGSFVCGWACPFGFLQDVIAWIPTRKFTLPAWTGHVRYVVLAALVVAIPYMFGEGHPLFFCRVCPAGALEAALPNTARLAASGQEVVWPTATKMVILGAFLGMTLFTWRPWCTMFCPLGAIYGLTNHVSLFFLRFHPDRCGGCGVCKNLCLDGDRPENRIDGLRCVRCLECSNCRAVSVETAFTSSKDAD